MANEEHLAILKQGVEAWNRWRMLNRHIEPNLREADLQRADLKGADLGETELWGAYLFEADLSKARLARSNLDAADLHGANLEWADLREAKLGGALFGEANLIQADLSKADLGAAILSEANLSRANLSDAYLNMAELIETNLSEAKLKGANLSHTFLRSTILANVDLSEVSGLESVYHEGPSTIGIDTLYKSKGKIPEVFLRGAGVPEELITYLSSLISGKAIQYYSCFISYSSKDEEFARRLHDDLQARGVRVWFAPEDIKGGRKLHEQIGEAIRRYDRLLLVLSENSMHSEWVKTEIYHARQNEIQDNCRKLFPIGLAQFGMIREWEAFDADTGKDMGREIREYYIPDFSSWKEHDKYTEAFERLMRDLNLEV